MSASDQLRAAIEQRVTSLASSLPSDRTNAIVALVGAIDRLSPVDLAPGEVNPFTGVPTPSLGANRARQLVLDAPDKRCTNPPDLECWAESFLEQSGEVARAELVLAHVETGFMRLDVRPDGTVEARISQRHPPDRWRERADDAWWSAWLERNPPESGSSIHDRAQSLVARLAHRYDLTPSLTIDGVRIGLALEVLAALIVMAERDGGPVYRRDELILQIARDLDAPSAGVGAAIDVLTLGSTNAAWHAAVPGIADPPIVRLPNGMVVLSRRGLTTDPFRFLTRELRRRAPEAYHAAAANREGQFRNDLYTIFGHRRFVTSPGRIELKGERGSNRTDIDAAIFDRKTGTLAIFELKTHEPFARSTAELLRTQANVRAAASQVAGALDWINRHEADEILNRIDRRTAKGYRVHKVQPFVLGRYLMDRSPLDRRAVWATWPQLLRVLGGSKIEDLGANPIMSLASRLQQDSPIVSPLDVVDTTTVSLGDVTLTVHARR